MRQMENTLAIPVVILTLGFLSFVSHAQESSMTSEDALLDSDFDLDRRPHDLGLGKRVYGYISEYKRLPIYNFGLGKRSHLYNFGLGKRSRVDEETDEVEEYDDHPYAEDDQTPELELYHDDAMQSVDKRQKLYSFGLGKRLHRYDFGLGKRGQVYRYDFGLGKRNQPTVSRDKLYNFGLGKRNRLYSFGLGKRPYNQGPVPSRFNFGLGKRSEDLDISKNVIAKREVHEENAPEPPAREDHEGVGTDSSQASPGKSEKLNNTAELESPEIMGHSERSRLTKRSPHRYAYGSGKSSVFRPNAAFSRQFRKPLYSFGLGKRAPSFKDLDSKNYKPSQN